MYIEYSWFIVSTVFVILQVSRHVGNLMDIYSTVLEIAGAKIPENYVQDGQSLTKTLFTGFETDER